jgi:HTH-type transcriptional regulator/antitoxin HipB
MQTVIRTPQQLSQALRAGRTGKHLTQRAAGADVGLLPKTISALELRSENSSIDSLFKLLSALELELVLRDKDAGKLEKPGTEW